MANSYDVAIIGAGAMGSSAAFHLSKTNKKILLIDQFTPPHTFGSSHGQSRIIREAYFESPVYVPLVRQAYELWKKLEEESGKKLFLKTGGLMLGNAQTFVVQGASLSADNYGIEYDILTSTEIKKRFPGFRPTDDTVALFEKNAGILFPEECIKANLELAGNKVTFNFDEKVLSFETLNDHIEIVTDKNTYITEKVIVSAGAWLSKLFPELKLPLRVDRQVLHWFKNINYNDNHFFSPENFPVYIWEFQQGKMFYGFPDMGDGIKIAFSHSGELTDPDNVNRQVNNEEINEMTEIVKTCFNIRAVYNYSVVCMYTNTPDEHFIIDYHPHFKNIIIASPCSGHGFKFSSAIGKILCDMATGRPLSFDISGFHLDRFSSAI